MNGETDRTPFSGDGELSHCGWEENYLSTCANKGGPEQSVSPGGFCGPPPPPPPASAFPSALPWGGSLSLPITQIYLFTVGKQENAVKILLKS